MPDNDELFPMQVTLFINGRMAGRGSLDDVRHLVAHMVTEWLPADPEGLGTDAQTVNLAFNTGAVAEQLQERGEWYTVMGVHSEVETRTVHIKREV